MDYSFAVHVLECSIKIVELLKLKQNMILVFRINAHTFCDGGSEVKNICLRHCIPYIFHEGNNKFDL